MRIALATLTSVVLIAAAPAVASAQEPADASAPTAVEHTAASNGPTRAAAAPRHGPSFLHVLAYGTGGSLVGGWTGFMTSQVIWSDWLGARKPDLGKRRMQFTVSGAALGTLLGTFLGFHGESHSTVPARPGLFVRPTITADEIRASSARDAAEAVRLLRPTWLRARGNDVVTVDALSKDSTLAYKIPPFEPEGIHVYVDDVLLGGVGELSQFPIEQIARIEFWDARSATLRWGAGNAQGAIRIVTSPNES